MTTVSRPAALGTSFDGAADRRPHAPGRPACEPVVPADGWIRR